MIAASTMSGLIDWIPDTNNTMPKPTTFQVIEITTAQKARSAETNQTIGSLSTWRSTSSLLNSPTCSSSSQNQSRLELDRPMITGTNTIVRVRRFSGVLSNVSSASA